LVEDFPAELPTCETMMLVRSVNPQEADELTKIALSAKRYWRYPERWIEIWMPQLMFDAAYFESHESWVAVDHDEPVGFYTLTDNHGMAWLENLWVVPSSIG